MIKHYPLLTHSIDSGILCTSSGPITFLMFSTSWATCVWHIIRNHRKVFNISQHVFTSDKIKLCSLSDGYTSENRDVSEI